MDTMKFVVSKPIFGSQTDVYHNGKLIPGVRTVETCDGLKGGYTVILGFFEGDDQTFYVDAIEVDDSEFRA